ncbi:MAG TPA: DUF5777 family beta-barrel protein [Flavilitoribacter sp.]|nr:DUF5777 family beta-barrel protein [Flavilitoribacter sp.]
MKKQCYLLLLLLFPVLGFSQTDSGLLGLLDEEETTEYITNAFKSPRVINGHSMEMLREGVLDFRILHRFGEVSGGAYEFFGLDNASMRMGFDYGLSDILTIGVGRSTNYKEFDGFVKIRVLRQSTGKLNVPLSIVWVSGASYIGLKNPFPGEDINPNRRTSYFHQVILGRKFSEKFTLQVAPFMVYRNFTTSSLDPNALLGTEIGARYKLSNRFALVADYNLAINRFPGVIARNPLSLGVDIETGGHVFQLHFSNAVGMTERSYISDGNGDWAKGEIRFGFNLSRVFQIKQPKN